ncbi:ABC transporter substrate-binding protein [Marinobacter halodurans]|uniref:ABC transporter substrate-binding protein n=1 Tax=Marinobacter halodurans TaxID=2528979 RepID=A0ABY1ZK80_9GAMM|nr:ABC transporter substrate binding protein [Marinobacter halodurans]TBW53341.1 ABC transporter substrate-binding protein [Marinobacter halodurans]
MKSLLRISVIPFLLLFAVAVMADANYSGKKILFIDSYHAGFEWSDGIIQGAKDVLKGTGVELKVVHMDTKRNTSETFIKAKALEVKSTIEQFKPDVLIASDDNASKYVIVPYYRDTDLPVIFCAVNWDASTYGFPTKNVTGMVEVTLVPEIVRHLKYYADGDDIGFIGANTLTARKEYDNHRDLLGIDYKKAYFARNFHEWKEMFIKLQSEVDMAIMLNQVGISGWNDAEAIRFVEDNTRIPVGSWNRWVMPYSLLGVTNIPAEQGSWAAQAALKVLEGVPPSKIPLTHNKEGKLFFNPRIGKRLGIQTPPPFATISD